MSDTPRTDALENSQNAMMGYDKLLAAWTLCRELERALADEKSKREERNKTDPVTRLHNLCDGLEEESFELQSLRSYAVELTEAFLRLRMRVDEFMLAANEDGYMRKFPPSWYDLGAAYDDTIELGEKAEEFQRSHELGLPPCSQCGGTNGLHESWCLTRGTSLEIREGQPKHPMAHLGEPYDCTRCSAEGCMTPADWPRCYTPPAKPVAAPSLQVGKGEPAVPEGSRCPLRAGGVWRQASSLDPADSPAHRALSVGFNRRPTDDELVAFHIYVEGFLRIGNWRHAINSHASDEGHRP